MLVCYEEMLTIRFNPFWYYVFRMFGNYLGQVSFAALLYRREQDKRWANGELLDIADEANDYDMSKIGKT